MDIKKLKKIAFLLTISLILVIVVFINTSNKESTINNNNNSNEISTESTVNLSYEYESGRMVQDYTNPTTEEKMAIYDLYGVENVSFTEQGLLIDALEYERTEKRLITNIWPDTKVTNKVVPPSVGEMYLLEAGQTYLTIFLKDVTEKELKKYVDEIEDKYSNVIKTKSDVVVYNATSDDGSNVKIEYNKSEKKATIKYKF